MVEKQSPEEQKRPDNADHLTLKVKSPDGNEIFFKIKRSTVLKKLMDAYCARQGVNSSTVRFLFDGDRIQDTGTPSELGMDDGDTIDAMVEQTGGYI